MTSSGAVIIDGKAIGAGIRAAAAAAVRKRVARGMPAPGLATILIGDDAASAGYVATKRRACAEVGITALHHELPADVSEPDVLELIDALNRDPAVSGILCQLPVPAHLNERLIIDRIAPEKDVDGLTIVNAGRLALGLPGLRPCTPLGVMRMLEASNVTLRGAHAVVLGRSNLVGTPMAHLLQAADATVTACHRHTVDLPHVCREADVLVVAVGQPALVKGDWVKPGATVIDVGINSTDHGLVGDVDFAAVALRAGVLTPVPGGVGPMTVACLLSNTVEAASRWD